MSKCGRTAQLEALLSSNHPTAVAELQTHASRCATCAHELRWLRTEEALFSQRRTRQQVRSMYPQPARPKPERRVWSTLALAIAASLLLLLGVGFQSRPSQVYPDSGGQAPMSQELASVENKSPPPCSTLQPGAGFACEPLVLASFR